MDKKSTLPPTLVEKPKWLCTIILQRYGYARLAAIAVAVLIAPRAAGLGVLFMFFCDLIADKNVEYEEKYLMMCITAIPVALTVAFMAPIYREFVLFFAFIVAMTWVFGKTHRKKKADQHRKAVPGQNKSAGVFIHPDDTVIDIEWRDCNTGVEHPPSKRD